MSNSQEMQCPEFYKALSKINHCCNELRNALIHNMQIIDTLSGFVKNLEETRRHLHFALYKLFNIRIISKLNDSGTNNNQFPYPSKNLILLLKKY
jgi:hypothetical protein